MTSNQIAYWRNVETERSNRAQEAERHRSNVAVESETQRHNIMQEFIGIGNLRETERHNLAYEKETQRHNIQSEELGWATLSEQSRHNRTTEDISYGQLQETQRHNIASENLGYQSLYETNRHNVASETLSRYLGELQSSTTLKKTQMELQQSDINSQRSLSGQMYGADFGYKAALLAHSDRLEAMNIERSQNIMSNAERERSNRADEAIRKQSNTLRAYEIIGDVTLRQQEANTHAASAIGNLLGNLAQYAK